MMKMKNIMIKFIIILTFITIFGIILPQNYSMADTPSEIAAGMTGTISDDIDTSDFKEIIGRIVGAIQIISALFAVLTIAITGFEYILCQTPDMRGELKKKMLPIIIAIVLIFGAVSIAQFVISAFE